MEKPHVIERPLGLDAPQLLNSSSRAVGSWDFFSAEARERRQLQLDHDIKHSPFYDSKSFNNTNGKIFTPPVSYFKADKAKYFPDFIGQTLTTKNQRFGDLLKGKVSIVRIYSTMSGEKCANTFFSVDGKDYLTKDHDAFTATHPHSQIIDLNLPQNWLKGFMVKLSQSNLKKLIPQQRHSRYFIVPNQVFPYDVKQKLYFDNTCSGYVFLLDQQGRIRWLTSGYANEKELALMWKCVRGLEREVASA